MRIIQRPETEELKALRALVKYRFNATCVNRDCKTSYEADWQDLEGFMDPESYVHVHCPTCGEPQIVDSLFQPEPIVMNYLRDMDVNVVVEDWENDDV